MSKALRIMLAVAYIPLLTSAALAGPVRSGNDLALDFSTADEAQQREIRRDVKGKLFFFRYLQIMDLEKCKINNMQCIKMKTAEPSSGMSVNFVVRKKVSLKKAGSLKKGEAIAVTGRILNIGKKPDAIILEPAIVRYKDRLSPAIGKELLYEVDPSARRGTDTSSGSEKIIW